MISKAKSALEDIKISEDGDVTKFIKKEPLGIVLVLTAWTYPYMIAVNSVIPAICAGTYRFAIFTNIY
jgi:acyl-CoA reductase-like NAD-dependent aldehyde dehydrogenase